MKKFKYIIDGKEYTVEIGNIVDNIAQVIVNGEDFNVELEAEPEPEKKPVLNKPVANEAEEESQSATDVNTDHAVKAPLPG
ncbi:MAG: acetyl-CoA carboxylase biotin carboxyl carrier protein subunit, partial [Hoylesella buccalis]